MRIPTSIHIYKSSPSKIDTIGITSELLHTSHTQLPGFAAPAKVVPSIRPIQAT